MNDDGTERAVEAYLRDGDPTTVTRLRFLQRVWATQREVAARPPAYRPPGHEDAQRALAAARPLFALAPPHLPADDYRAIVRRMAANVARHAGLASVQSDALRDVDVAAALPDRRIARAAIDPRGFIDEASEVLSAQSEGVVTRATAAFVVLSALTPFLIGAAAAALASLDDAEHATWGSLACPVCGSPASLGVVSESTSQRRGGRRLWCVVCHTGWGFDRLRCARCGTRAAAKLHYAYDERDPAHRVHLCDECHGYLRVVFARDLDKPLSMPVEEAVSVGLDALACAQGYTASGDGGRGKGS